MDERPIFAHGTVIHAGTRQSLEKSSLLTEINKNGDRHLKPGNKRCKLSPMILPVLAFTFFSVLGLSCVVAPFLDAGR